MMLIPPRIRNIVKVRPGIVSGWVSPYPTVASVMIVMYNESKRDHPSREWYPRTPAMRIKTSRLESWIALRTVLSICENVVPKPTGKIYVKL
jgi:hypothetical protein